MPVLPPPPQYFPDHLITERLERIPETQRFLFGGPPVLYNTRVFIQKLECLHQHPMVLKIEVCLT